MTVCEECGHDHETEWYQRVEEISHLVMFIFDKKEVLREEGLDVCLNVAMAALRSMEPDERAVSAGAFCEALREGIRRSLQ